MCWLYTIKCFELKISDLLYRFTRFNNIFKQLR